MAFRNLMEGACGEVNSLEQLFSHMKEDVARQDSIGHPSRSSDLPHNNFMPPQSFRVHDLLNEMEVIEPQRSFIPDEQSTPSLDFQWTTECHEFQETRDYSSVLPVTSFENVNMMNSRDQPPWNVGLPNPQVSCGYPQPHFEPQLEEISEYFCNKSGLVVHSLDQLDDSFLCVEQNEPPLENKVEQDTESKPVSQKYWSGIPIYDESALSHMLTTKTKAYTFISCLNYYAEKSSEQQWLPKNPNQIFEPEFVRDKLVPHEEFDINLWHFLQIYQQNKLFGYFDSFCATKQILRLDSTHTFSHMVTMAYLEDGCFYKAFTTMVNWLKNHKSYGDIPLNFSMVQNLSGQTGFARTWIDSNRHIIDGVKNMLLTAARRNPTNADLSVQSFLSFIFSFTMEFDKSADCLKTIAHAKKRDVRDPNACYNVGINLFLGDKPNEALDDLLIGIENSDNEVKDLTYELIGIIYMYLTDYRKAIRYFKEALEIDPLDEEFALPDRGDILKAENELCLLLYSKLYNKLNPKLL